MIFWQVFDPRRRMKRRKCRTGWQASQALWKNQKSLKPILPKSVGLSWETRMMLQNHRKKRPAGWQDCNPLSLNPMKKTN
jgi:hypothetical protein